MGPLPFSVPGIMGVTVGRREGEPNIMVIYDGEIIGGMTWEKRSHKKIAAEPRDVCRPCRWRRSPELNVR
jgi:hypothetical protein